MIDLHLHLDGSLSEEDVLYLAKLSDVTLPNNWQEFMHCPKDATSLVDYLRCFDLPLSIMQVKGSLAYAVKSLIHRLHFLGLIYAEIRFAPQLHLKGGMSQEEVVLDALDGLKDSPIPAKLILCAMRGEGNEKENLETLRLTKKYLNKGVCAFDLAGAESLYHTDKFNSLFKEARKLGVPFTIHAGESEGCASIDDALSFEALRIGHGVRAKENELTMLRLKENKIFLEICPTSNLDTKAFKTYEDLPIRTFLLHGIHFFINSDNMSVSNTNVNLEYRHVKEAFKLHRNEIYFLLCNAIEASFTNEKEKWSLKNKLDEQFTNWCSTNNL